MPRPPLDNPKPESVTKRRQRGREKHGLVFVQIGSDRYEVTEFRAEQIRNIVEDHS